MWGTAVTPLLAVRQLIEPYLDPTMTYEVYFRLQRLARRYPPTIVNRELLESLRGRSALYLISNTNFISSEVIREWLSGYPFAKMFFSNEVGVSKPHRDMFSGVIFHAREIQPTLGNLNLIHVGDNDVCDIEGAKAAGFSTFKVESPKDTERWLKESRW